MREIKRKFRLQSAMEYLMTYGWAILIIAVVLGALFALGIFNGPGTVACIASPGFLCQTPTYDHNANISFTFGQNTGSTIYNLAFGCSAIASSNGLPSNTASIVYVGANGFVSNIISSSANTVSSGVAAYAPLTLSSGQQITVGILTNAAPYNGLDCFSNANPSIHPVGSSGNPAVAIGTTFTGALWVNYTLQNAAPSATNPLLTQKFATIQVKVSR